MNEEAFEIIITEDTGKLETALKQYLEKQIGKFSFPELSNDGKRRKIWNALYSLLKKQEVANLHPDLLTLSRVLSREKTSLEELVDDNWIELLIHHACLKEPENLNSELSKSIAIEALKCLCNVIFNCSTIADKCSQNGSIDAIVKRIKKYEMQPSMMEIKYFDMKILFLVTALCKDARSQLHDMGCVDHLLEVMENLLKEVSQEIKDPTQIEKEVGKLTLSDEQADFACELLKVLFNITMSEHFDSSDNEEIYKKIVTVMRHYLLLPVNNQIKKFELHSNIANLLTNVSSSSLKFLITPVHGEKGLKKYQFNNFKMLAVQELVNFLDDRFVSKQPNVSNQRDWLLPILTVLLKCATSDRNMRKYLRKIILPPLKDVHNRPEEGCTLRNHLCRLLTTPITEVRDLVAELLFVLCKENVGRMIKYTGYGNAAGLFANRGLLAGRNRDYVSNYSSDSEDSETEEYKEYKHAINPVMGCYEPPHPSPFANMTEEQKEYEAMKLVELMDNLTRHGVVRPCKVGADGRPEPIEHVLQLQEGLPDQQVRIGDSDSE